MYPVVLEVGDRWEPGEALKRVKETLRAVPRRGIGHGLLRHLRAGAISRALAVAGDAEVSFNYLGQLDRMLGDDGPLGWAEEPSGSTRDPEAPRSHLLDVNAQVLGGRLEIEWTYPAASIPRAGVEEAAARVHDALEEIVAHCTSPGAGGYTPSDFPQADLSQEDLDALLRDLEGSAEES